MPSPSFSIPDLLNKKIDKEIYCAIADDAYKLSTRACEVTNSTYPLVYVNVFIELNDQLVEDFYAA